MLPPRCSRLPCMNIEVKIVTHQGAWSGAVPDATADLVGRQLHALLARVGELVGDRAVLEHALVPGRAEVPEAVLEQEVDRAADRDDRHGEHREAAGRDVVLEREHV